MTIRKRAETVESAKMLGIEGRAIGSDRRNGMKKPLGMVGRTDAKYFEALSRGARFHRERQFEPTGRCGGSPRNSRPISPTRTGGS